MVEPGEYVVCTFWRSENGQEIMHVYVGYGTGEQGKTKALRDRFKILRDHKERFQSGPSPIVKAVRVNAMEMER